MRRIIRNFDRFMRYANGVFEYSTDPDCILRLRHMRAPRTVVFDGQTVLRGAPVVEVHFFNEHMPPLPETGSNVAWAAHFGRLFIQSFRDAAVVIDQRPELQDAVAVCLTTVLSRPLFERLGFIAMPVHSPLGRFGIFWENLYTWGLMYTYNHISLRRRSLLGLERREFWATRQSFMRRYLRRTVVSTQTSNPS